MIIITGQRIAIFRGRKECRINAGNGSLKRNESSQWRSITLARELGGKSAGPRVGTLRQDSGHWQSQESYSILPVSVCEIIEKSAFWSLPLVLAQSS